MHKIAGPSGRNTSANASRRARRSNHGTARTSPHRATGTRKLVSCSMRGGWSAVALAAFAVLAACSSSGTIPATRQAGVTTPGGGSGFIPRLPGTRVPASTTTTGGPPPTAGPGRPRFVPPPRPADPSNLADWNECAATLNQTAIRSFGRQSNANETIRYCGPEPPTPTKSTPAVYSTCVQKLNSTSEKVLGRVATPAELSSMCGPPP